MLTYRSPQCLGLLAWLLAVKASAEAPAAAACRDASVLLQTKAEGSTADSRGHLQPALTARAAREAAARAAALTKAGRRKSNRQAMINFGEAQYVSYLTIGRQIVAGILDSGSFELVVFGADCRTCGAAAHYNSHLSSSYRQGILMTQQSFGSGDVTSVSGLEEVAVGPFPAVEQGFWNVQKAQMSVLGDAAFEAVIGLGPPETPMVDAWDAASAAVANVTAYYDLGMEAPDNVTAVAQAQITVANEITQHAPLLHTLNCTSFSVCIGARPDSDGVFVWNDLAAFEHPLLFTRVPVAGNHSWSVNLTDAFLDYPRGLGPPAGKEVTGKVLGCEAGCHALLDSGTSLLAVPRRVMQAVQLAMTRLRPDCSNLDVLPDLVFKLGGSAFRLPPDAYMAKVTGSLPQYLQQTAPHIGRDGQEPQLACQMMLMETSSDAGATQQWILGIPFFRRYYTTFVLGHNKAERHLLMAPHGEDDSCTPVPHTQAFARKGPPQLRYVAAERVRFPQASVLGDRRLRA